MKPIYTLELNRYGHLTIKRLSTGKDLYIQDSTDVDRICNWLSDDEVDELLKGYTVEIDYENGLSDYFEGDISQPMIEHLIEAAFEYIAHNDRYVIVRDPAADTKRLPVDKTYRVYRTDNNPDLLDWGDAPRLYFKTFLEAEAFIQKSLAEPESEGAASLYERILQFKQANQGNWTEQVQKEYWGLLEAYEQFQQSPVSFK
ncbi:MAG: hypothetical protein ACRC2R_17885 [Xenococcaceae cyanobacterium]